MPPVQAGMEPSASAATSAPMGVRSLPSREASAACSSARVESDPRARIKFFMRRRRGGSGSGLGSDPFLEGVFHRRRDIIAIAEEIIAAGSEEIHVTELERPGVAIGEFD